MTVQAASFDIGKKNFAFYVERFDPAKITEHLETLYTSGSTITFRNSDLTDGEESKTQLNPRIYANMYAVLQESKEIFDACDIVLIERQMTTNNMALKLAQHCYSWFLFTYGQSKEITEYSSVNKTKVFDAPTTNKNQRKRWSEKNARHVFETRGEFGELQKFDALAKRDDVADALNQLQSFKFKRYVPKKPKKKRVQTKK